MPRDIQIFLEVRNGDAWIPYVTPLTSNAAEIYGDYNPDVWTLFGIEGKYPVGLRGLPKDCSPQIISLYKEFGDSAFDEHWLSAEELLCTENLDAKNKHVYEKISALLSAIGESSKQRFVLWFSQ